MMYSSGPTKVLTRSAADKARIRRFRGQAEGSNGVVMGGGVLGNVPRNGGLLWGSGGRVNARNAPGAILSLNKKARTPSDPGFSIPILTLNPGPRLPAPRLGRLGPEFVPAQRIAHRCAVNPLRIPAPAGHELPRIVLNIHQQLHRAYHI